MGLYEHSEFIPTAANRRCDSCGYGPVAIKRITPETLANQDVTELCEVCYKSMVGTWTPWRNIHDHNKVALGVLIAWCTNHLKANLWKATRTDRAGPETKS